jgi:AcrR family transcriptional regulator
MSATIIKFPSRTVANDSDTDRRSMVIGAAIEVLSTRHARDATLEEIANTAGLTLEEIRALFEDVPQLYEAVMRQLAAWVNAGLPSLP